VIEPHARETSLREKLDLSKVISGTNLFIVLKI
jgi:hypothetical protein